MWHLRQQSLQISQKPQGTRKASCLPLPSKLSCSDKAGHTLSFKCAQVSFLCCFMYHIFTWFFFQKHALVFVFQVMHAQHVAMSCWDCLQGDSWRIRGVGQVLSMLVASTPMPAQHLWTAEQGLEVSCISAAVCYAGVGRSRHVSCTWLAICCLLK